MKNKLIPYLGTLAILFAVSCTGCQSELFPVFTPGSSQKPGDNPDPESPVTPAAEFDWSKLTASNHPRIIFSDSDFRSIAAAASSDEVFGQIHKSVISLAQASLIKSDLKYELTGKRLLSVSRDAEQRILSCAYAYKTTGEEKYLTCAEHNIVTVCNFQDWNAKKHFLDVGEMAAGVGLAYDWLYDDLQPSTKTLIVKALNDFAFTPANNKVWNLDFYQATNNWNQVCNGGLVCAALAIYEEKTDIAKGIIEKGVEANETAVSAMYSPDGNYPEGYSYWNYGTIYQALLNTALETSGGSDFGLSNCEGFNRTGQYILFMEGPLKQNFNYSDSASSVTPCIALWYFAWKYKNTSLLYIEKDRLNKYASSSESRLLPLIAWYAYKLALGSVDGIPVPSDRVFAGRGITPVVLVHGNWKLDLTDKFLGVKAGKGNSSHSHLDAGTFIFDAEGVRWAADLGLQSYSTLEPYIDLWNMNDGSERWTSFRYNNFNHNTITVNDAYHRVGGEAKLLSVLDSDGKSGAVVDITAPLSPEVESAKRTIYLENDNLVVRDEIKAPSGKDAKVRWMMITTASPEIEYGAVTLKGAGSKYRYLKVSSPTLHKPTLKTSAGAANGTAWSMVSANSFDQSNSGYYKCGYELTVKAGASATVEVTITKDE